MKIKDHFRERGKVSDKVQGARKKCDFPISLQNAFPIKKGHRQIYNFITKKLTLHLILDQVIYEKLIDLVGNAAVPLVLVGNKNDLHMDRRVTQVGHSSPVALPPYLTRFGHSLSPYWTHV
jgi:hypothetical protein